MLIITTFTILHGNVCEYFHDHLWFYTIFLPIYRIKFIGVNGSFSGILFVLPQPARQTSTQKIKDAAKYCFK